MVGMAKAQEMIDTIATVLNEGTEEQCIEAARQLRALALPHRCS